MRRAVHEIRVRDERGGQADHGTVERRDEDLRVRVESVCDFEVVGDEVAQVLGADGGGVFGGGEGIFDGDVGAGGEVAARACQDREVDVWAGGDGAQEAGEAVIEVLG